ncbi:MAG: hypothetical protein SGJ20_02795 [Planctomycetota bacterium]|nr:hypothetical protein [Planctomycetota bacterium]
MKTRYFALFALLAVLATVATLSISSFSMAEDAKKEEKKEAAFCPVGGIGHDINKEVSVDFAGGKVYFCCDKCPAPFEKDTAKFTANAHHQMVATKQLKQTACPLTGKKVNPDMTVEVAGVEVGLCCGGCKGKINKIEKDEEKIEVLFKDTSKGFKLAKKESASEKK